MNHHYYEIAILKSPMPILTFSFDTSIEIGTIVSVQLKQRKQPDLGVVIAQCEKPDFKTTLITALTQEFFTDKTLEIAKFIATYYVASLGEALGVFIPHKRVLIDHTKQNTPHPPHATFTLSSIQQKGYEFIKNHQVSLLFADTGSGKTEIYQKMIEQTLDQKKQAVYLLPEIALTPQMEKRLTKSFGDQLAIWHSKITQKKKNSIIEKLHTGEITIVAGARSALFLPYSDLGLIIVDEEHDDSYKSEQKPRLSVKDLAIYMGKKHAIKVILGSATPSLNSFAKIPYWRNKETFHATTKQFFYDISPLKLTHAILSKIEATLAKNEQIIIFLPTRANFKYQICTDCGKAIECPFCSVALSLHKSNKTLQCHYCNFTQPIIESCPSCHTGILKNYRLGTSELKEQLESHFPTTTIATFDRDSVTSQVNLKKILKEFNENKIEILIGTQMLSKGHDYHNVTLAIILGIDSVFHIPNYRAREKALSLAIQIAGRSGRNGYGEVLIQTLQKDFFEKYMDLGDYETFLQEELLSRGELYPPAVRLARVIFAHTNGLKAKETMLSYLQQIKINHPKVELIGYKECSIFKIANRYRYEILLRSHEIQPLLALLHSIDSPYATIDMDTIT